MGRAINKAVTIAEILKRKMPLHQCNALSSVEMIDIFEPLEEGLDRVTSRRYGTFPFVVKVPFFVSKWLCAAWRHFSTTLARTFLRRSHRHLGSVFLASFFSICLLGFGSPVSCMQITLSKTLEGIDVNDIGYQPPLPPEEMNPGDFHPMREASLLAS